MTPTAVITGASRGHGLALARFLARRHWSLVVTGRGRDALEAAARELNGYGDGAVHAVAGDVTDAAHRARVAAAAADLAGVDLLVNNASTLGAAPLPPLTEYPPEALRRALDVNVVAPVALTAALLPALRARRGLVANVTSDAAVGAYPGWGGYGASKAALDLATRTLAAELADAGVAVVAVDPGDMRTAMHQAAFPGEDISHRPDPEVTLPFWAWLLEQAPQEVSGARFEAQGASWTVPAPEATAASP